MGIIQDLEAGNFAQVWTDIKKSWEGSTIGTIIDNAAAAAWAELQTIAPTDLESAAASVATGILTGIAAGNPTSAIIATGITAAEAAFASAAKQISSSTVTTFVSAVHNQVSSSAAAAVPAPAAAPTAQ